MSYGTPFGHLIKTVSFSPGSMSIQPLYPLDECVGDDQETQRPFNSPVNALPAKLINRPSVDAIPSFPFPVNPCMVSQGPSQALSTPTSSSARSPATDSDWYPDAYSTPQILDDLPFPNDMPYMSPELGTVCTMQPQVAIFAGSTGFPCINISQVQTFSDPPDYTEPLENVFEPGERYLDLEQTEFAIEVDPRPSRGVEVQTADRRSLASSRRKHDPMDAGYIQEQDLLQVTTDIDGNIKEDDEVPEEEALDTDYTPKRSNRRRATYTSKSVSSSSVRRGRATKSKSLRASKSSKDLSALACKSCKAPFNDHAALQLHVEKEHPRPFTCIFNFAGCPSTFASKNKWKRHITTQHLSFNTWVCNLDACGKAHTESSLSLKKESKGTSSKGAIFNRKDLFTQHLRRMHAPNHKRRDKQKSKWEDKIKDLQKDCLQVNRQGPKALNCPVVECRCLFSGPKCWDDCMEHVAKHLEKVAETSGAASVRYENDELLIKWAQSEGIINFVDGEYKLIPISTWLEGLDQNAEATCQEPCASATPSFPALDLRAVTYSEQTVNSKHEDPPNLQANEMEYTDSGYISALNSNYYSNEQGVVDKAEVTNPDATNTVGDDIQTTYSAATTVIPEIARQSISDLCKDIYNRLEPHVDKKTWESLSSTIPGLIKILALKLGLGASDEFNMRIMHFVHKHHQ